MSEQEPTQEVSCREAGRRGGKRCSETHGPEYYKSIGQKGGSKTRDTYGSEFYRTLGQKGGTANAATHDHEHFVRCGQKAGERIKQLVALGKAAEAAQND